jgi:hypothetical protein
MRPRPGASGDYIIRGVLHDWHSSGREIRCRRLYQTLDAPGRGRPPLLGLLIPPNSGNIVPSMGKRMSHLRVCGEES